MEKPIIFPVMRHSDEAENGAEELIQDIKNGTLKCSVDPLLNDDNLFNKILANSEKIDFTEFANSKTGKLIIKTLDDEMENDQKRLSK